MGPEAGAFEASHTSRQMRGHNDELAVHAVSGIPLPMPHPLPRAYEGTQVRNASEKVSTVSVLLALNF